MTRTKLQTYIDVLKALLNCGPSKMTRIAYASNLKFDFLKRCLDFLIKQGAIEERIIDSENSIFAITQQGIKLLKFFWQPELSLIENEKYKPERNESSNTSKSL